MDAADVDDNGTIDITDAIGILEYLFRQGKNPESPFPDCGVDPSADQLDCRAFPLCKMNVAPKATFTASVRTGLVPLIVEFDASASSDPDGQIVLYLWDFGDGATAEGARSTHTFGRSGSFTVALTVTDDLGESISSSLRIGVRDAGVPADPIDVAPPLDGTSIPSFSDSVEFLYSAADTIQTGVAPDAIVSTRAAVLRGQVSTRDGAPLASVAVNVLDHPELGSTLTRPDGMFDLVVNGGGAFVVHYARAGYLPAQRQIDVPWQDYRWLPDVVLIPVDSEVSAIDLSAPLQVARGSPVTDSDGTRQATLLFPQGTTAEIVFPGGAHQPLTTLNVRATEYTVGEKGPETMPADLPPTSAYTYCVEFSADEAMAAGAIDVRFSAPLPFYVEDFLGFPVGTTVPLGSYDRTRGVWIPAESGKVIKILSVTGGAADLDTNGDGLADIGAALAALSITDAERQRLAALYQPGQSLWRVLIPHFTPWDLNWPYGPPADAEAPDEDPEIDKPLDNACPVAGNSVIEVQNQILGEAFGVVGTDFDLHYQSERVPGHRVAYSVEIPLAGDQPPASLRRIELEIQVAGQFFRQRFPAAVNQQTTFTWDGRDAYGRRLQGAQPVTVRIGYTYGAVYNTAADRFGSTGASEITGSTARQEVTLWRTWEDRIGAWDARAVELGGWALSAHHAYDPSGQVLYQGDGQRESADARTVRPIINTVAGPGAGCHSGDGGPATLAAVCPAGLAVGADGSIYIAVANAHRVRRVAPDGIINTVAGTGSQCFSAASPCGDGGPAAQAKLSIPFAVAIGPDESLYIGEIGLPRVRKVDPDGIISTIAGTGVEGFSGDGGPGNLAQLNTPRSLAVGPDNSVYVADSSNSRIRRVGPDGIITTVAGTGSPCNPTTAPCGDGGPATLARLSSARTVAVDRAGNVYILDTVAHRVRQVTPDGIIRTIAGTGAANIPGDGGPATAAHLLSPIGLAVGPDGSVYIADEIFPRYRIRWLRPEGVINALAGSSLAKPIVEGGLAIQAELTGVEGGLAVGPDGSVYVSTHNSRVRRISPISVRFVAGEIAVPANDGSEVYLFTPSGRHLRTQDALTGALRYQFAYDSAGRLASITDRDGNVTTIERDGRGRPITIVGPFGQATALEVDDSGYLSRVTNPAGEAVELAHTDDGLLTGVTRPGGHSSGYAYDPLGRLEAATDPTGASKTLARSGTNKDFTVTLTNPLGRATTYRVERLKNNDLRMTTTGCAGAQSQVVIGADGRLTSVDAEGITQTLVLGPDPRWGMQAPLASSQTITTPGGLVQTTTTQSAVTLAGPGEILNLRSLTDTETINGRAWTTTYDGPSRTLVSTSPAGRRESVAFNDHGRPVQAQLGDLDPIAYTYDARGRRATVEQGQGAGRRVAAFDYGPDGFLSSIVDPLGRTTAFANDDAGRVTQQTLSGGQAIRFAYDSNGNLRGVTPPGRLEHAFAYTPRDEVAAYTPPVVDAEGAETRFTYDADRNPTRVDHPDGGAVQFQYESGACHLSLVDLDTRQRNYAYDDAGQVISLGASQGISLAYAYDGGIPTGATWSGAVAGGVAQAYDSNFRVTALRVDGADPVTILYDADNLPVQAGGLVLTRSPQIGLITGSTLGAVSDATTYDGFGAPVSSAASYNGSAVYAAVYTRDSLGRISQKAETLGGNTRVFDYAYDPAERLSEVRQDGVLVASYSYDPNGNRLTRTDPTGTLNATFDSQDRLLQYGSTTYDYNANGERVSKSAGGQTTAYQYEGFGSLTGVTLPGGTRIEYLLDALDRRVGTRVNGTLVRAFLYQDGLRPIAELNGAGVVVSRFVYATQRNVPEYMVKGGVTYRIIADYLGSPRLVLDIATGQIAERMDHDGFGRVTLDTNPGFQPFGFAGGLYDLQTGLVHFGAREYDPETGRWTTKDPIGFDGGDGNLYAYVGNEPVNNVDPEGLCFSTLCGCLRQPVVCAAAGLNALSGGIQRAGSAGCRAVQNIVSRAPAPVQQATSTTPKWDQAYFRLLKEMGGIPRVVKPDGTASNIARPFRRSGR